jgi:hypothetical protein
VLHLDAHITASPAPAAASSDTAEVSHLSRRP